MTFLQWLKNNKNNSENIQIISDLILKAKNKPLRCNDKKIWESFLIKQKNGKCHLSIFDNVWSDYSIQEKLEDVDVIAEKHKKFNKSFKASKDDLILMKKIRLTLEDIGYEIERKDEWVYFAKNHEFGFFFMPADKSIKGFVFVPEFAPEELIPYGSDCRFIYTMLIHMIEFNEAYRNKQQKEIK